MVALADNAETSFLSPATRARAQSWCAHRTNRYCTITKRLSNLKHRVATARTHLGSCSKDPIGYEAGSNCLYEYCHSEPTKYIDPWGKQILPHNPGVPSVHFPPPPPRPEIKRPRDLCADLAEGCPGCSQSECERVMDIIEEESDVTIPWYNRNKCIKYTERVEPRISLLPFQSPCLKSVTTTYFPWFLTGGHAAIEITLCDSSIFYLDGGWTGIGNGNSRCPHFGLPCDIKPWHTSPFYDR